MFQSAHAKQFMTGTLVAASALVAGPITTVAWNGYTGAASFTYDDGRPSQLTDLMPQVDKLGLKVTFFLANNMYSFPGSKSAWINASKNGHELANHSGNHNGPTAANIKDMATTLRALDPSVDAVTYAYPNCTVVASDASGENFMARGCGSADYAWGTQPSDWMNVQGLILSGNSVQPALTLLDKAKQNNSWVVTIVHDVTASPDQYSLTPANNQTMLDKAVSNKLWIAPYGTIGAYYKAHFVIDKLAASAGAGPWNLTWSSPSAKMPKSVPLKVKLDAATFGSKITVTQDGAAIAANADGSYTIDFMKLKLSVASGSSGIGNRAVHGNASAFEQAALRRTSSEIVLTGIGNTTGRLSVRDLSGRNLASQGLEAGSESARLALDPSLAGVPLLAVLTAVDGSALRSFQLAPVR